MTRECSVDACDSKHFAKGYCDFHYRRLRRFGSAEYAGKKRAPGVGLVRDELGRKECIGCQSWLSIDSFYGGSNSTDRLSSRCKECAADFRRLQHYGVPLGWYAQKLNEQQGKCAVCGHEITMQTGNIDHDHSCCDSNKACGKCVRGLLCRACNVMLGAAHDNESRLLAAISYLKDCR